MQVKLVVHDWIQVLVRMIHLARLHQVQDLAATIAFWAFFSIFPLMIGIIALAGHFLESAETQARVLASLTELLPGSASIVQNNIEIVLRRRGTWSWIAIVGVLWSAGKGFGAMTRSINRTLEAEPTENFLIRMVRQFLMTATLAVMVTVAIGLPVVLEVIFEPAFMTKLGLEDFSVPRLEGWAVSFLMMFLVFGLIYRLAPYVPVRWRDVMPGALLAAVAFELGKAAFVLYLDRFAQFESIYGPLTSIIVLLLWLYVSALIFIVGAEYNVARWQMNAPATTRAAGAGEDRKEVDSDDGISRP